MSVTCAAYAGEERWENLKGRSHLENLDLERRIILKRIFKKWYGAWTRLL
jgi:hypothetical protein